jgi:hypothetical protein
MGLSLTPSEGLKEATTLWVLLDVSNSMRGATIESARNVLKQYVLGQLIYSDMSISLITFGNIANLLTETPLKIGNFQLPEDFAIGGLCNLSDAVSICESRIGERDKILLLTKGFTTDSYGNQKHVLENDCHAVILDSSSNRIPVSLGSYFSGRLKVYNMKEESLTELSKNLNYSIK